MEGGGRRFGFKVLPFKGREIRARGGWMRAKG